MPPQLCRSAVFCGRPDTGLSPRGLPRSRGGERGLQGLSPRPLPAVNTPGAERTAWWGAFSASQPAPARPFAPAAAGNVTARALLLICCACSELRAKEFQLGGTRALMQLGVMPLNPGRRRG